MLPFQHNILKDNRSIKKQNSSKEVKEITISGKIFKKELIFCPSSLILLLFDIRNQQYSIKLSQGIKNSMGKKSTKPQRPNFILSYKDSFTSNYDILSGLIDNVENEQKALKYFFKYDIDNRQHQDTVKLYRSYTNTNLLIINKKFGDFVKNNDDFMLKCHMKCNKMCLYHWILKEHHQYKNKNDKGQIINLWTPDQRKQIVDFMMFGGEGSDFY